VTTEAFTIDKFRQLLEKRYANMATELIEAGRVNDYLCALDESPHDDPKRPVPPLFLITLGRQRRPHLAQPGSTTGGVNASDAFEFYQPVYIGDVISVIPTIQHVESRHGRSGELLIATVVLEYRNQHGTTVARRTNTLIRKSI